MLTTDRYAVKIYAHEPSRPPEDLILKEQARVEGRCIVCGDRECQKHADKNRKSEMAKGRRSPRLAVNQSVAGPSSSVRM